MLTQLGKPFLCLIQMIDYILYYAVLVVLFVFVVKANVGIHTSAACLHIVLQLVPHVFEHRPL